MNIAHIDTTSLAGFSACYVKQRMLNSLSAVLKDNTTMFPITINGTTLEPQFEVNDNTKLSFDDKFTCNGKTVTLRELIDILLERHQF